MQTTSIAAGINIFSGEKGLGGALTNPSALSKHKGNIGNAYPIVFLGCNYVDAEAAYQGNKIPGNNGFNDLLMTWIIATKFKQHSDLAQQVQIRGGSAFLRTCDHFTHAKTMSAQKWEGSGMQSRFIRNLVAGYDLFVSGNHIIGAEGYENIYKAAGVNPPEDD